MTELPGGGFLVAHKDSADHRLIAIDGDGSLRWERSLASLRPRTADLLAVAGETYVIMYFGLGRTAEIEVFHLQAEDGHLTRVFRGGSRSSSSLHTDISIMGESVLISIADVGLFALEPKTALEAIQAE